VLKPVRAIAALSADAGVDQKMVSTEVRPSNAAFSGGTYLASGKPSSQGETYARAGTDCQPVHWSTCDRKRRSSGPLNRST